MKVVNRVPTVLRKAIILSPKEILARLEKESGELPPNATLFVAFEQPDGTVIRHALDSAAFLEIPFIENRDGSRTAIMGRPRKAKAEATEPEESAPASRNDYRGRRRLQGATN